MTGETRPTISPTRIPQSDVESLAEHALAILAASSLDAPSTDRSSGVRDLYDALANSDQATYQQRILSLIAEGDTSDDLIDHTIPDLARGLGEEWCADKVSFADVTIGMSRLQQTVRRHGAPKEVDGLRFPLGHRVLLVLPEANQHSLGIFIIANQLRRLGVWVQLALDCKIDQIGPLVEDQNFAMIGLSIGAPRSLEQAHKLTQSARDAATNTPIILGGAAFADDLGAAASDFGADFIAKTAQEALDFCQPETARPTALPLEILTT